MNVFNINVEDVVPYENNPRKNDVAVSAVAKSIQEFGFRVPIIIDKENVIVAGHTRLRAAEQLGMKTVPAIRADDLTDEQVKAFRLVDNKTAELSAWDYQKLADELVELRGVDMAAFGFRGLEDEFDVDSFFSAGGESDESVDVRKTVICPCCGTTVLL